MVEYQCEKCSKIFDRKYDYERHKKIKNDCSKNGSKVNKLVIHQCEKCDLILKRKDYLTSHRKICKGEKKIININGDNNKNQVNYNDVNYNDVKNVLMTGNNSAANQNSNNIINLVLINYGTDGCTCLTPTELIKVLQTKDNLISALIKEVNFNPNKPEHYNVYYPDLKSACGVVFENKKWINKKIDEILNKLVDAKIDDLKNILYDGKDILIDEINDKIKKTIETLNYCRPNERKKLFGYIKPILFDNKNMIIKTRKLFEFNEDNNIDDDVDDTGSPINVLKKRKNNRRFGKVF